MFAPRSPPSLKKILESNQYASNFITIIIFRIKTIQILQEDKMKKSTATIFYFLG